VPIPLLSIGALLTLVAMPAQAGVTAARPAHQSINCAGGAITCTEVNDARALDELVEAIAS
jgi:hypothetical protein